MTDRPVPTLAQQQQYMIDAVNSDPARLGPCHICDGDADGECAICARPVCDDDARMRDGDRYCLSCAP